jgi:hypothetical protein
MRITLKVATILTWFNLFIWGYFIFSGLLGVLSVGALPLIAVFVLLSAIPLNCYAALQLQKSIRRPDIKLSSSTPTGIRFVGIAAFLFAVLFVLFGVGLLQNLSETIRMLRDQYKDVKGIEPFLDPVFLRKLGLSSMILGLCVGVNVLLNLRLLRWYYLVRQSDVS